MIQITKPTVTPPSAEGPLDIAQLAEAFALFSKASQELSEAYAALQGEVAGLTERMAVLLAALPAGVVVLDRNGRAVQSNRAALALFGAQVDGQAWADTANRLQSTETPGEWTLEGPAGARRVNLAETELESGEGRIVLIHDVTDRHRLRLAAERNERLAAMGEMVAGLAHQLRTPLAAALLYTGNLRQPTLSPADRARVADRAVERLHYLERLIADMLLFARGERIERERFAVADLVAELLHTLDPVARAKGIAFTANGVGDAVWIEGDRKGLGGALTNLLENAFEATPSGGKVTLRVGVERDMAHFAVQDSGRGIDPALQGRLFEPFFTTRAEGTGLGLAIARGVARAHGGDIELHSAPGSGSSFVLSIPLGGEGPRTREKDCP
ncbi:MAG: PAS domain-containing sensor histidine kinase [Zoogloeaceae bacterium]|nr:PAS domain-containing sensor histidine kinase [Zoogloeaceae bacterium]